MAALLDLPFASGVRRLEDAGSHLRLELEHDDGMQEVEIGLPAVLSVAERLCDPCKVDPEGRAAVPAAQIIRIAAANWAPGPGVRRGARPWSGRTRPMEHQRSMLVLQGPIEAQAEAAVRELTRRGALTRGAAPARPAPAARRTGSTGAGGPRHALPGHRRRRGARPASGGGELLGAAAHLAREVGAVVHALCPGPGSPGTLPAAGADLVVALDGSGAAEDIADAVIAYVEEAAPWAVLAPSTAFGREVAGRAAAATGSGLVGDAIALSRATGCWSRPSPRSPARWWPTSRAAAQRRWSPCGRACCPRRRPGHTRPRQKPGRRRGRSPHGAASGCSPNTATTTWRPWPGPRW